MARIRRKRRFSRAVTTPWWPELEAAFGTLPSAWKRPETVKVTRGTKTSSIVARFADESGAVVDGRIRIVWPRGKPGRIAEVSFNTRLIYRPSQEEAQPTS